MEALGGGGSYRDTVFFGKSVFVNKSYGIWSQDIQLDNLLAGTIVFETVALHFIFVRLAVMNQLADWFAAMVDVHDRSVYCIGECMGFDVSALAYPLCFNVLR